MDTNINYTAVGAFVIILFAAMVLGIIWLSAGFTVAHYSTYIVYSQESVTGLAIDSPVEYNGVEVGSVKSIELNHKNPHLVELLLNIKNNTPITRGTTATLATRGITGITYIALKDDSKDLRPLIAEPGQAYPVIKTSPSIFVRLDTALSRLTTNFEKVTQSIQQLLDKENQQSIKMTLANLARVTQLFAANSQKLDAILSNTAKASQQISPLLQSSAKAVTTLETQTLPVAYRLLSNLDQVTQALSQVAEQLKQNPSMLIRGVDRQATGPGERK